VSPFVQKLAFPGSSGQVDNYNKYWGRNRALNATVVVYPATVADVSLTIQAAARSSITDGFAFVSGGHGQTGAATSNTLVIDLAFLNSTQIITDITIDGQPGALISYEGGGRWAGVYSATNGSGWAALGARVDNVGVGGFSTGGGIGFLAGAAGYATDRMVAFEVVLVTGEIVVATKTNRYSDLFWALSGGGGQFGIVTKFYQKAFREPPKAEIGIYTFSLVDSNTLFSNVANFFAQNKDPFALMYFGFASSNGTVIGIIVCLLLDNPADPSQLSYNATFSSTFVGTTVLPGGQYESGNYIIITSILDPYFVYGERRGFYGPQVTTVSIDFLNGVYAIFNDTINGIISRGDNPGDTLWVVQYMNPTLNGNAPKSDVDTAWPHSTVGHQTLLSPAWQLSSTDEFLYQQNAALNTYVHQYQSSLPKPPVFDYPNYVSPDTTGHIFGNNLGRLETIKQQYDPTCLIRRGLVFKSKGCATIPGLTFYSGSATDTPTTPTSKDEL